MPDTPLLLFDGHCGFCRIWVDYWKQLTGNRIAYAPAQERGAEFPQIPAEAFSKAVVLVAADGSFSSGAEAVFESLEKPWLYELAPRLWDFGYALIARNRGAFYQLTRFTFGKRIEVDRFARTQNIFLTVLGLIYASAFLSLAVQVTGLIGERGILPAKEFFVNLRTAYGPNAWVLLPSIFWLDASDAALRGACWLGVGLSLVAAIGWARRFALLALYVLYLSFSLAGQAFLGFQWDALLLEAGFLAIFFGKSARQQRVVAWLYRIIFFKLYFLSGWVKLASGDKSWTDRSALLFHFHTQPLPTVVAWYADQWPAGLKTGMTSATIGIELLLPFLIFAPRLWRLAGAVAMVALQVAILLTGNYAFFNVLTLAMALYLFDDRVYGKSSRPAAAFAGKKPRIVTPKRLAMAGTWLVILLGALSVARLYENIRGPLPGVLRVISDTIWPLQVSNSYGLFAIMTRVRPEIIVEGSADGEHWQAYEFRYKPGDVNRAPGWVAPHQPRLDWQMWFAALDDYRANPWFAAFAEKLLEGSPEVRGLLAKDPFAGAKPRFVRGTLYDYRFSRPPEPGWWVRQPLGVYFPAVGLKSPGN